LLKFFQYFQSLKGDWELNREISDGSRLEGSARFTLQSSNQFLLEETGKLTLPDGASVQAHRNWIWQFEAENKLNVFYAENPPRLYHALFLKQENSRWIATARHECAPDIYDGMYIFRENFFEIRQTILGPKKDFKIESLYERA